MNGQAGWGRRLRGAGRVSPREFARQLRRSVSRGVGCCFDLVPRFHQSDGFTLSMPSQACFRARHEEAIHRESHGVGARGADAAG